MITHGDLYAHNILYKEDDGKAKLTDFGAASVVDLEHLEKFEKLEVLAYGYLLEELL